MILSQNSLNFTNFIVSKLSMRDSWNGLNDVDIFNLIHPSLFKEALKFGKDVIPPQLIAKNLKFILEKVTISNLNLAHILILFGHYVETLPEKNCRTYVDNYFSSVQLTKFLYLKWIYLNSSVRQNKKLLPQLFRKSTPWLHKKMKRGEHVTFQSSQLSNLMCTQWLDTKAVLFLSTLLQPNSQTTVMCRVGHRYIRVSTPRSGKNYSKFMTGVDKYDKILSCFKYGALGHGTNKIWKRLFWHLVNICAANAWILFSETSQKERSKYYDNMVFHCELAKGLIGGYTCHKWTVKTDIYGTIQSIENISSHHFVQMKSAKSKPCVHHSKFQTNKKKRYDSLYGCFQWNSHMCHNCFCISHTTGT